MNKSFKVVFNKARGALMVVNEVTSSVQAKGTKTVIAAAVASLVAGAAMATTADTPKTTVTWSDANVVANTTFDGYVSAPNGEYGAVVVNTDTSGTRVGLVFTNNKSAGKAGALAVEERTNIILKDAQFTGNEAAGFGGAIRVYGANTEAEGKLTLETSKDVVYAGNKAGTQTEVQSGGATGLGGRYADMGGFAYLQGNSELTLKAAEGTTLTIGQEGAHKTAGLDSIVSGNNNNKLVVDGTGTVKVNGSMESFRDAINVKSGTLVMATGFGSVDIGVQAQANTSTATEDSGANVAYTATMTVESGASVDMGALVVNAATADAAGTKVVVNDGGKVTVDSVHVTTAVYKDKAVANTADKLASGSLTTTGHGEFSVATSGAATVTKDLTVDAATKFDKTGDGLLTVQGTLSTAAAVAEASGQTAKAAGEFNLNAGSVTTNGYVNAGKTTLASGTTLKVTGTAENSGLIEGTSGNLTVAEGAVFKNAASGSMTGLDTLTVEKGATLTNESNITTNALVVNGQVNTLVKDTAANLQFNTVTLNEGGAFNMTNAVPSGGLVFVDGTVNFKGGDFQVGGKVFQGDMTVGGASNNVIVNFDKGNYTFGKVNTATAGAGTKAVNVNGAQLTVTELTLNSGASAEVSAGALTVDTLKLANSGAATVNGGTLTIKTALDNTTSAGALTVGTAGTLATSTVALGGLTVDASGAVSFASGSKFASGSIANTGTIVLSGLEGGEYTAETLKNVRAQVQTGTGLLDLGKVTVKDALTSGGDLQWTDITGSGNLAGIGTEQFAGVTVTGVSGNTTANGSYGAFELASKEATAGVGANTTLTLNGTGALVQFVPASGAATVKGLTLESGAALVTTGKDALIGKVSGASGALNVASGSLKVEEATIGASGALIDVDTLTIGEGAGLSVGLVKAAVAPSGNTSGSAAVYGDINVGTLTVEGTLDASVNKVTVTSGTVTGVATVKDLSATNTVAVGTADATGLLVVEKFTSGTIFADPSWESGKPAAKVAVKELASGASVHAGRNSIVALGTTDYAAGVKAVADAGFVLADATVEGAATNAVNSALYVTGTKSTDETTGEVQYTAFDGKVLVDNASGAGTPANVKVDAGSLMVLDVAAFDTTGATAVFKQNVEFVKGSTLYLANVVNGNKIQLSASGSGLDVVDQNEDLLFTGDMLMEAKVSGGNVEIAMADKAEVADDFGNVPGLDLGYEYFKAGANLGNNSKSAQFANWLWSSQNHDSYAAIRTAAKDVASLGATTGVQTVTMDAVNMMADTAAARTTMLNHKAEGAQVWADVNGGAFEAESLFGGAGYKSDIWAGTIGVDYTAACGGTLGVALTVGTADTDSTNTGVKSSADSDLLGFTVYASQTFNDVFGLAADLGYLKASNEVKANGYEHSWKFDQDTDAFTFGLRGEVLTKVGGVNIVPHAGLRYTRLSTDGFEAGYKTEFANQNVFQLPLGVTVAAEFESADWTFAPKFDLSVVPTFGDKDAEMTLGIAGVKASEDLAVRVLDSNPVQATLGVSATTGAWNFGINYKLGAGSDDRMNNTFNANVRYAF